MAREVTSGVILSSIAGYLLMGIIYSIFIAFIIQQDPAAFTPQSSRRRQVQVQVPMQVYRSILVM